MQAILVQEVESTWSTGYDIHHKIARFTVKTYSDIWLYHQYLIEETSTIAPSLLTTSCSNGVRGFIHSKSRYKLCRRCKLGDTHFWDSPSRTTVLSFTLIRGKEGMAAISDLAVSGRTDLTSSIGGRNCVETNCLCIVNNPSI